MRVLIPLPDNDFDVTEVAVPWRILTRGGHDVTFATERAGTIPAADQRLLDGVVFGKLGAEPEARAFYREMTASREFGSTVSWAGIATEHYDGLLLPGGHAPRMRQYLASEVLQAKVAAFAHTNRPIAAICHGVLVLARSRDPITGRSVLAKRRTTCLPKYLEALAFGLTFWKLGRYYRTYPAYVEDEVRAALDDATTQFQRGPLTLGARGSATDDGPAFVVEDANYVSARWPGDSYLFARRFDAMLRASNTVVAAASTPRAERART